MGRQKLLGRVTDFYHHTLLNAPEKKLQAVAKIRTRLKEAGIMRESGREHFTGSLVVPVMDLNEQALIGSKTVILCVALLDACRSGC